MNRKKEPAVLLHLFSCLFIVIGVAIMYNNTHYGEGLHWISHEVYEDTPAFNRQFKSDLEDIFNYVKYKEVFETDGRLDYLKPIIQVTEGPGTTRTYTVDEMIRRAKSLGYYLNERFKVSGGKPPVGDPEMDVRVDYRAYEPDFMAQEPGDSFLTLDELAYEVLSHLGNYYSFYYRFIQNPSNLKFEILYQNTETDYKLYTNATGKSLEDFKAMGKYLSVTGEALYMDTNLTSAPQNVSSVLEQMNPYDNGNYHMTVAVDTSYPCPDSYALAAASYDQMRLIFIMGIVCLAMGLLGWAATLYCMVLQTNRGGLPGRLDKLPAESAILVLLAAALCALFLANSLADKLLHLFLSEEHWFFGELVLRVLIWYGAGLIAVLGLLKRYKAGTLWSKSLTRQGLKNLSMYFISRSFTTRLIVSYGMFLAFQFILLLAFAFLLFTCNTLASKLLMGVLAVLLLVLDFWVFYQMYRNSWETDQINQALLNISKGDTTYKIQTGGFSGKERELAENINHISLGLESALQEKVRSERLKADLITNVSHDIKTPLTSIINYVDLIKREQIENPKIQGYLEVLEQKSLRLKTLTEDLVEASKASSGNLKLEMTSIDFVELLWQTNGEFEEKFALRHLELVPTLPSEPVLIEADGRHLWRVLENLYNNTFKYAMEHSRVYVDMELKDGQAIFTIKNISQNPLNIHAEELTERFVRGDVARTTEGSGLGLSIAKNLTELQGGTFTLYIDGDLFKARVAFPVKKSAESSPTSR